MPKKSKIVELDLNQRLRDSEPHATSLMLPLAVHHRLEILAQLAEAASATRKEIVGMLIAEASLDPARLEQQILDYRRKTNGEVIPDLPDEPDQGEAPAGENVVRFELRGPGRPRQEAG
jgi:hypothetical protein